MNKIFLPILFLILSLNIHSKCTDPVKDYAEYFGSLEDAKILKTSTNVKSKDDFTLTSMDSCGSRGCEYALYVKDGKCFKRVFDFNGGFKVLDNKTKGFKDIQIKYKDTHLSKEVTTNYSYSKKEAYYVKKK